MNLTPTMNRLTIVYCFSIIVVWLVLSIILGKNNIPADGSWEVGIPFVFVDIWRSQLTGNFLYNFSYINFILDILIISGLAVLSKKGIEFLKEIKVLYRSSSCCR